MDDGFAPPTDPAPEPVAPPAATNGAPQDEHWQLDSSGKEWVPRKGKRGKLFRQQDETVAEARERDGTPGDERRPRRKPAKPKTPRSTRKTDLKQLEGVLADALRMPGVVAAGPPFFDQWAPEHFNNAGPYLARNLINSAEYNPWLKRKLEEAASGEDAAMKVIGVLGITGAVFMYLIPPTIYFLNLRVPDKTREMFGIPDRREPDATVPPPDQAPEGAFSPADAG